MGFLNMVKGAAKAVGGGIKSGAQAVGNKTVGAAKAIGGKALDGAQFIGSNVIKGAQATGSFINNNHEVIDDMSKMMGAVAPVMMAIPFPPMQAAGAALMGIGGGMAAASQVAQASAKKDYGGVAKGVVAGAQAASSYNKINDGNSYLPSYK